VSAGKRGLIVNGAEIDGAVEGLGILGEAGPSHAVH
jgi:hypothetical protein